MLSPSIPNNGEQVSIKVEVPDAMVGAILGRGKIIFSYIVVIVHQNYFIR